ncbi:LuxR C-terminal-related transcriptional regulator [Microbacterium sp. 179-B 1A2 NHS]|uniref:LuxR C-terminal-related transcriptional regulator n=1 Tax=Microbacterium sp. 179-B 1A2 NHS TaxID=3142383 RepID=UPI0039A0E4DF
MALSSAPNRLPSRAGIWPLLAHARVDELIAGHLRAPRCAIIGPAGSGKTVLLRLLAAPLQGDGDAETGAAASVRFVDDAHLLDDDRVDELSALLDDPSTGLILATRPWPRSERLRKLMRRLEQAAPPIVLGHLDTRDVTAALAAAGRPIGAGCVSSLVHLCGSVTWLLIAALAAHGDDPCADPAHEQVSQAVAELVAERLQTVEPDVAEVVRRASLGWRASGRTAAIGAGTGDDAALAHAEGLLMRNGDPIPVVRAAVLRTTPVAQMMSLLDDESAPPPAADVVASLGDVTDPRLARVLLSYADAVAGGDVARAMDLYDAARMAGADPLEIAVRTSRMAWDRGEVDDAAAFLDALSIPTDHPAHDRAVDLVGAVWSARGYLEVSAATYAAHVLRDQVVRAHAAIAALGAGDAGPLQQTVTAPRSSPDVPTTLSVAVRVLLRGLAATVATPPAGALDDLVRASEIYGESGEDGPIPELPAVLAALTALNAGDLDAALAVLGDALMADHGGAWARPRLLLWTAWVFVQMRRPEEAAARLTEVDGSAMPLSARDVLLRDGVHLAFVRRFGAAGELRPLWHRVRDDVRRVEPDLFALHVLGEFLIVSGLLGDAERLDPVLATSRALLQRLGDPPLWAAPLHWATLQRAVIIEDVTAAQDIAGILADMAPHGRVAAAMSAAATEAMRIWHGTVNVDQVEAASAGLAAVGFAWEGARLAQRAAVQASGWRAIARLTALARELHPGVAPEMAEAPQPKVMRQSGLLSPRELEVAALVVSGKTYAEIGETIFISPRTAEHHIARIRRRLGATSRTDLIEKLRAIVDSSDADDGDATERRIG